MANEAYGGHGDPRQQHFDRCLSHARNVVECAFGRLKAHWRCLTARLAVAENTTMVITACVVLYICEHKGHILPKDPAVVGSSLQTLLQISCGRLGIYDCDFKVVDAM